MILGRFFLYIRPLIGSIVEQIHLAQNEAALQKLCEEFGLSQEECSNVAGALVWHKKRGSLAECPISLNPRCKRLVEIMLQAEVNRY